jgi:8-oxo-dGTP diphosphatase
MSYTYEYPRPAVTVDIIVIKKTKLSYKILLIERKHPPYASMWALPGGFVDVDENLIDAAYRELKEETNIHNITLEQFYTYGDKGRDPRGHTVSVIYYGYIDRLKNDAIAGDDAAALKWFAIDKLPTLAFDHDKIIKHFVAQFF